MDLCDLKKSLSEGTLTAEEALALIASIRMSRTRQKAPPKAPAKGKAASSTTKAKPAAPDYETILAAISDPTVRATVRAKLGLAPEAAAPETATPTSPLETKPE